jgi:sec-independent protein translocase protein TatA
VIGDILQPTHLLFVLVIALLVLGPKRLPEVGRSLGRGIRDFKTAIGGEDDERPENLNSPVADTTPAASSPSESTTTLDTPAAEHGHPEPAHPEPAAPAPEPAQPRASGPTR